MSTQPAEERISLLEQELRLRDEFIAVATHELRNPLTPISLEVEVLLALARRRGNASAAELASLERLQRSIRTFIRRATTFLDVTRIRNGNFQLERQPMDLSEVLRRVIAAQAPLAALAGCPIETQIPPRACGNWDPMALEQILENLISNALRYGAGALVRIAVEQHPDAVDLQVSDCGAGIRTEHQARIFDLFDRGSVSGSGLSSGSLGFGVGLWISRQLARAMGGEISVKSTYGEGACFILRLPTDNGEKETVTHGHQQS